MNPLYVSWLGSSTKDYGIMLGVWGAMAPQPQIFKNNFSVFFLVKIQIFNSLASKKKKKEKKKNQPLKMFFYFLFFFMELRKKSYQVIYLLKKNEITNRLCKQYKSPTQSQYFFVKIIHGYSLVFLLQVYLRHLAKRNSFTNLK